MTDTTKHLHLISDSTGETLNAIARAVVSRFEGAAPQVHLAVFVRSKVDLDAAIATLTAHPGFLIYTLADPVLRNHLRAFCTDRDIPCIAPLEPVIDDLADFFGRAPELRPGMQHRINNDYFARISALDFAIAHDDGALSKRLEQADVILTGVSRTSKTPTCIYLAYRGIKAANIPLVPGVQPEPAFLDAMTRGVPTIGLTASPGRLSQVRAERLEAIGSTKTRDYAEIERIRAEVADARLFFDRHTIPVIDVTRRSIEETAAEVLQILRTKGVPGA